MADDPALPALIEGSDIAPFATIAADKLAAMIEDATAQAIIAAPCLSGSLTHVQQLAVKGVLRAAILRWNDAGSGAKSAVQLSAGPFQQSTTIDTTSQRRGVFWPSEITALQTVCRQTPKPYTIDMGGGTASPHLPWCARSMGANYCDCGAELGMEP